MLQNKVVEKKKIHYVQELLTTENCAFYEIIWKDMEEADRPQTIKFSARALHAGMLGLQTPAQNM